jgi:hypothetical protein
MLPRLTLSLWAQLPPLGVLVWRRVLPVAVAPARAKGPRSPAAALRRQVGCFQGNSCTVQEPQPVAVLQPTQTRK